MSDKNLREFLAKVDRDDELARKVKEAGTDVGEIIRLGKKNGCEFTAEDLKIFHDETKNLIGEGLQIFMEKVSKDEELARKLGVAGTDVNEIIRLGKENGCEFTEGNLAALQDLDVKKDEELSDEDLENVAGGVFGLVVGMAAVAALALSAVAGAAVVGYTTGKGGK